MTTQATKKTVATRVISIAALLIAVGLLYVSAQGAPFVSSDVALVAALGFLLLTGTLAANVVELLGVPHLTGYIGVGVLAGPHVLGLLDMATVKRLAPINTLALALIALAGGAELRLEQVRSGLRSIAVASLVQSILVGVVAGGVFVLARPIIPFASEMSATGLLAVGILWGAIATSRSPSAMLGILAQTRARGPLTSFALAFVMTSDVIVILLLALGLAVGRPLLEPGAAFTTHEFYVLGREILAGISVGTTLGLVLVVYIRLFGKQLVVVLIALGFGASEVLRYLQFDPLLTFVVAGFVVQNVSKQGDKLLAAVEGTGTVVYVLFFASAGAELDIPLLRLLWPVALVLAGTRAVMTFFAARVSSRIARDTPTIRRWAWTALIAQAGLTQGLANVVEREYPSFGSQFRALVIANVALNAIIGPILFKLALDRAGESRRQPPEEEAPT